MSSTPSLAGTTSDEAPMTLAEAPVRRLGIRDGLGLWGNLGISLLLPVAAVYVVVPGGSLVVTMAAVVVGAVIGSVLLGAGGAPRAGRGRPPGRARACRRWSCCAVCWDGARPTCPQRSICCSASAGRPSRC